MHVVVNKLNVLNDCQHLTGFEEGICWGSLLGCFQVAPENLEFSLAENDRGLLVITFTFVTINVQEGDCKKQPVFINTIIL